MSSPPVWLQQAGGRLILKIHAQPGAKRSAFAGTHGDALKIRLAAPALEGKANAELLRFVADALDVSRQAVTLLSGDTSRNKRLAVEGVSPEQLLDVVGDEPEATG